MSNPHSRSTGIVSGICGTVAVALVVLDATGIGDVPGSIIAFALTLWAIPAVAYLNNRLMRRMVRYTVQYTTDCTMQHITMGRDLARLCDGDQLDLMEQHRR